MSLVWCFYSDSESRSVAPPPQIARREVHPAKQSASCSWDAPAVSLYKKLGFAVAFEDDEAKTSEEKDGTVKSVPAAVLVMRKSLK